MKVYKVMQAIRKTNKNARLKIYVNDVYKMTCEAWAGSTLCSFGSMTLKKRYWNSENEMVLELTT